MNKKSQNTFPAQNKIKRERNTLLKHLNLAIICLTYCITVNAQAEIYQWKDNHGRTHFSDKIPKNHHYKTIKISPTSTISTRSNQNKSQEKAKKNPASHTKPPKKKTSNQQCNETSLNIARLQRQERVFKDENDNLMLHHSKAAAAYQGKRFYISDEERPGLLNSQKEFYETICNDKLEASIAQKHASAALQREQECYYMVREFEELRQPKFRISQRELDRLQNRITKKCSPVPKGASL